MNKTLFALCINLLWALPTPVHAAVTMAGSVSFDYSSFSGVTPTPAFYGFSDGNGNPYYGNVIYANGSELSYPFDPNGTLTLDPQTYQDSRSGTYGSVSASWNQTTGATSLGLVAQDDHIGATSTTISLIAGAPIRNLGSYAVLPDITLAYSLSGTKDSELEGMSAYLHLAIGYTYYDSSGAWNEVKLLSGYPVTHQLGGGNIELSFIDDGTLVFEEFSTQDSLAHDWYLEYDLQLYGSTNIGIQEAPVPEPATLLLTGLGLLGLGSLRRARR